jgi:hypothetical protein
MPSVCIGDNCEMLPLGLALKQGIQPLSKAALLVHQNSHLQVSPRQLKIVEICYAVAKLCFLYALETQFEMLWLSLDLQLGFQY